MRLACQANLVPREEPHGNSPLCLLSTFHLVLHSPQHCLIHVQFCQPLKGFTRSGIYRAISREVLTLLIDRVGVN